MATHLVSRSTYDTMLEAASEFDVTDTINFEQLQKDIIAMKVHPSVCLRILKDAPNAFCDNKGVLIDAVFMCRFISDYPGIMDIRADMIEAAIAKGIYSVCIFLVDQLWFEGKLDEARLWLWKALYGYLEDRHLFREEATRIFMSNLNRYTRLYPKDRSFVRHLSLCLEGHPPGKNVAFGVLRPVCNVYTEDQGEVRTRIAKAVTESQVSTFISILKEGADPCWWKYSSVDDTIITTIIRNKKFAVRFLALLYTHRSFESLIHHVDKRGKTALQQFRSTTPKLTTPEDVVINNVLTTNTTRATAFCLSATMSENTPRLPIDIINIICKFIVAPSDIGFWNVHDQCLYSRPSWTPDLISTSIFGSDLGIKQVRAEMQAGRDRHDSKIVDKMMAIASADQDSETRRQRFETLVRGINGKEEEDDDDDNILKRRARSQKRFSPKQARLG